MQSHRNRRWALVGWLLTAALGPAAAESFDDYEVLAAERVAQAAESDLLSAGLGLSGLQASPPGFADARAPTAGELRRLAIHNAWNALAILGPSGGVGEEAVLAELPQIGGREISALLRLPGASQPFRVLVQIPARAARDPACLLVAPASGSRGVYGAIQLAGPGGLMRGCAVAYTDKGAGTDFQTFDDGRATDLAGTRVAIDDADLPFKLSAEEVPDAASVAIKHLHSGDHPEADWGRHVLAAAHFGREQLRQQLGDQTAVRIVAVGLSNGGGAALRAAERDTAGLLDGVVAVMPNITPPGQPPLYDYATLAALYQPCTLADAERTQTLPLGNPLLAMAGQQRCNSLAAAGLLEEASAAAATEVLVKAGFDEGALRLAASSVALDLWRVVASGYASAYLRRGPGDMPCGYALSAAEAGLQQRAAWWATHSGVGPGGGISLDDGLAQGEDETLPGLQCLRALWTGEGPNSVALRRAVEATRASARLPSIPVLIVHGREDGLIPASLSSRPYVAAARERGAETLAYWEVERAQHFDALLNVPGVADQLVPILPYGWLAIEQVLAGLAGHSELGGDRRFAPQPGAAVMTRRSMGLTD
ncbi:3-hydroxybutyrate oligomer hydrolase family protein [Wenzhouxiangella limi]|uniref:Hydrogenase n=1 Tax=Wenzhouxiangella limi TaxID=2707351 RepID=A0A845V284_9GAMM|nr:3-hydroxybutyrate oligomer hydrolase family protein [Wenzhouxiangella limi]NDY96702.1 hydrogenase [Wenzhouxiangella limi]